MELLHLNLSSTDPLQLCYPTWPDVLLLSSAQERYWFCTAPANLHDPDSALELQRFASSFAAWQAVKLDFNNSSFYTLQLNYLHGPTPCV